MSRLKLTRAELNIAVGPEHNAIVQFQNLFDNLGGLEEGHIWIGDASDDPAQQVVSGDITLDLTGIATIVDGAVTYEKLQNATALSVLGRASNTTGDLADIVASNDAEVLRRSGTTVGFGTIATAGIANDAVTYAKIQNVTDNRLLGRSAGSGGDVMEITVGSGLSLSGGALTASGGGTVTSVAQTVPVEFSVAGSPVTTSGTLAITKATQNANLVWAGPNTGAAAQPTFRSLVTADLASQMVTYAKIQNVTDVRLLGNSSGGAGSPMEITVGAGLSLAAGALTATGGGTGDVVGPASATDTAVALFNTGTGKLIKNSTVLVDTSGNVETNGAVAAQGGSAPSVGTSQSKAWVTSGTALLSMVASGNSANARHAAWLLQAGGIVNLKFYNDAFNASVDVFTITGSSAGVTSTVINGTAISLTGLTSVSNALKVIAGGAQPGVTVSGTNSVVVTNFPYRQWIDAAPAANNRIVDMVWASGVFQCRFVNDAYGASTPFFSVTGGHAAGVTAISFPAGPVAIAGAITASSTVAATGLVTANAGVLVTNASGTGSLPGVTVSATKSVVNGGFPYRQWIDAAQSANNKMIDIVFAAGAILHRFVNDAYGASTTWMSVAGGHAAGVSLIAFPSSTSNVFGHTAANANAGVLQTRAGTQTTNIAGVGGTIYVNTTQTGNTAATETNAFSHTVAGNTLTVNGASIEFYAAGTFATSASVDKRVKAVFGGTTLFDSGALAVTVAADWSLSGRIIRTGAATQKATVTFTSSDAALRASTDYTTPAETLSGNVTMKLTINGTNANDTVAELYKETWAAAA